MKCKKCKSGIISPIAKTTNVDGIAITSSSCPVCGENLDSLSKCLIILIVLIIALGVASKYFF